MKTEQARADFGTVTAPGTVRFEGRLPGPIERVRSYLTQSEKRGKWLAPGEMEKRVGVAVELKFHHASLSAQEATIPERFKRYEAGHVSHHRVIRFEPPRLLSLTWSDGADGSSEVSFGLTPEGGKYGSC